MVDSVQTSVEQINLIAAQLRYKIESTLQLNIQQKQQNYHLKDDVVDDRGVSESISGSQSCSNEPFSVAAALENDFLHREVSDLKQTIDRLSLQLRAKDSALKLCKDDLKQEKINSETIRREQKQISADAKANERYVKCVQIEYELLRNMTAKSQEAFFLIGDESIKQAAEIDKTSKMIKKQMKEMVERNLENKNLIGEVERLNADITKQRATAGVNSSTLKQCQLEIGRITEKEKRLASRIISATERLEKERNINKMLTQTVEETELKAATAFEGISVASHQQSNLVKRLNDYHSEIVHLKELLRTQQSSSSSNSNETATKRVDESRDSTSNAIKGVDTPYTGTTYPNTNTIPTSTAALNPSHNESKSDKELAVNSVMEKSSLMPLSQSRSGSYEVGTNPPADDQTVFRDKVQDSVKMNVENKNNDTVDNSDWDTGWTGGQELIGGGEQGALEEIDEPKKRRRIGAVDDIQDSSMISDEEVHRGRQGRNDSQGKIPIPLKESVRKLDSINHRNGPRDARDTERTAIEELDAEDERCPVCLDTPFGLMMLCCSCRKSLHSACARKAGGSAIVGNDFRCPQCQR